MPPRKENSQPYRGLWEGKEQIRKGASRLASLVVTLLVFRTGDGLILRAISARINLFLLDFQHEDLTIVGSEKQVHQSEFLVATYLQAYHKSFKILCLCYTVVCSWKPLWWYLLWCYPLIGSCTTDLCMSFQCTICFPELS